MTRARTRPGGLGRKRGPPGPRVAMRSTPWTGDRQQIEGCQGRLGAAGQGWMRVPSGQGWTPWRSCRRAWSGSRAELQAAVSSGSLRTASSPSQPLPSLKRRAQRWRLKLLNLEPHQRPTPCRVWLFSVHHSRAGGQPEKTRKPREGRKEGLLKPGKQRLGLGR